MKGACKPVKRKVFEEQVYLYFTGKKTMTEAGKACGLCRMSMMKRIQQYITPGKTLPDCFFGKWDDPNKNRKYSRDFLLNARYDAWDEISARRRKDLKVKQEVKSSSDLPDLTEEFEPLFELPQFTAKE